MDFIRCDVQPLDTLEVQSYTDKHQQKSATLRIRYIKADKTSEKTRLFTLSRKNLEALLKLLQNQLQSQ